MKDKILIHAVRLAAQKGYQNITRTQIAKAASVSPGLVSYYLGDMRQTQRAIMQEAVNTRNLTVVAQGLTAKHPAATGAPAELRIEAARALAG